MTQSTDHQPTLKRPRGRPRKAFEEMRINIKVTLAPDVHDALSATGNASRTIDDLVRRYLMDNPPLADS